MDRSSTQAEWVAGAAPLFPNIPPVVVSSRWPDGQASENGLHVSVDGKHPRSCRFLSEAPGEEVYGERSALERGRVRFLSEAPGEEVYGERSALEGLVV